MRRLFLLILALLPCAALRAQDNFDMDGNFDNGLTPDKDIDPVTGQKRSTWGRDTSKVSHTVPTDFFQWRIDERLGTQLPEAYNDTLPHLFQNFDATEGLTFTHAYLGNLGAPRYAINALDRKVISDFMFMQPYDYFHTSPSSLLFTNT